MSTIKERFNKKTIVELTIHSPAFINKFNIGVVEEYTTTLVFFRKFGISYDSDTGLPVDTGKRENYIFPWRVIESVRFYQHKLNGKNGNGNGNRK